MIYLNDHIMDFDLDAALCRLPEQRRAQALRYKFELGRRTCVAAYLLLCEGLQREYGITERPVFVYGEHGKPSIAGHPEIHFNMSHCREAAICVLSDKPVGCDVETVRRYNERLVCHTMNEAEQAQIRQSDRPDMAFTKLWTRKEAVLKRSGEGITRDLKTVLCGETDFQVTTVVSPDQRYIYSICK